MQIFSFNQTALIKFLDNQKEIIHHNWKMFLCDVIDYMPEETYRDFIQAVRKNPSFIISIMKTEKVSMSVISNLGFRIDYGCHFRFSAAADEAR